MNSVIKRELRRKIIHILTGVFLIGSAFLFKDIDAVFWVGIVLLVPFGLFYFLVRWFDQTFIGRAAHNFVERSKEDYTHGIGGLTYIGGVILSYVLFHHEPLIVLVSIVVLAFGDGFASFVGMKWGKHQIQIEGRIKTIEGFAGGFFAATLASLLFVDIVTAVVVSGVTMFVELVGIRVFGRDIPDNLYLPVVSGIVLYLLMTFV